MNLPLSAESHASILKGCARCPSSAASHRHRHSRVHAAGGSPWENAVNVLRQAFASMIARDLSSPLP